MQKSRANLLMTNMQNIITEYVRLRKSGQDAKHAFNTVRTAIQQLDQPERDEIIQRLRVWETMEASHDPDMTQAPRPQIKRVSQKANSTIASEGDSNTKIVCPKCGKSNAKSEAICYSCGELLSTGRSLYATRTIIDGEGAIKDDFFGEDSVLILQVHGTEETFRIQPQMSSHEIIIGRNTQNSPVMPDIDLSKVNADEMGVSRMHLGLRYDAKHQSINIYDMGSANGSFLNEQRIHPQEVRILHHGDALRLGALILVAHFEHH